MLREIAYLSEILSVVFFLCFFKRNRGEGLWIIFLSCVFSIVAELAAVVIAKVHQTYMFYFWASYTIVEYSLFALFFFFAFKNKKTKYIPLIGTLLFYSIVFITFYQKNTKAFDSLSASMEAILMIIYSIIFLYSQITNSEVIYVYNTKRFWIVIAIFVYFSSTLFLFLFAADFINPQSSSYWIINNLFEILKNTLFCISFAMKKNDSKQNSINYNPDLL